MNIYLQIIFLSMIQGLTEFLPVSSSGHLLIAQRFINFQPNALLVDSFLHLGTLLAVIFVFWKDIVSVFKERNWKFVLILFIASIPTAIIGLGLEKFVSNFDLKFMAIGFFATAMLLIMVSKKIKKNTGKGKEIKELTVKDALIIGTIQGVAVLPGVSRSGSTLFGSIFRGLKIEEAFKFVFLLSIPAILGANAFEIIKNMPLVQSLLGELAVGLIISCIFGIIGIRLLGDMVKKAKLWYFSIYLIIMGIIWLIV